MAETRDNGYVNDKLLKKKRTVVSPLFGTAGTVPPLFGRITEKITATFPHPALMQAPIQENVWWLGLCPRNRVGAHIIPRHRPV